MSETPATDAQLRAYFARIGYAGSGAPNLDTLRAIVLAHAQTIPFENLDVLLQRHISLEDSSVFQKLVEERRGGYCFEQNGLLLRMLLALGFHVRPISGRVRLQRPRDMIPPRTHVFLRLEIEGVSWLADVGVGGLSPTAPLLLDTSDLQTTPHEPRRILRENGVLYHQVRLGDAWEDVCEFTLEEMPRIDREIGNWFTSTHPESHFKNRLLVARAGADGERFTILNQEFAHRTSDGVAHRTTLESPDALLRVLRDTFGLVFPDGTRFDCPALAW